MNNLPGLRGLRGLLRSPAGDATTASIVALLMLTGFAAFAWTGFAGNPIDSNLLIGEPWSLFLWFYLLIIGIQVAILRDRSTQGGVPISPETIARTLLVTTFFALVIMAVRLAYLVPNPAGWISLILHPIRAITDWFNTHRRIGINLLNLGLLLTFAVGTLWGRRHPDVIIVPAEEVVLGERTTGDLLSAAIFSLLLSPFFLPQIVGALSGTTRLTACDTTLVGLPCQQAGPLGVSSLFFWDLIVVPSVCLLAALLIITFAAVLKAIQDRSADGFIVVFVATFTAVLGRRINLASLTLTLRIFWPAAALVAILAAAAGATTIQKYLYAMAESGHGALLRLDTSWPNYLLRLEALLAVAALLTAAIVSVTLQAVWRPGPSRWQNDVAHELGVAWGYIRYLGLLLGIAYWTFSLIFWLVNTLGIVALQLYALAHPGWHPIGGQLWAPFIQPDPLALLSISLFVVYEVRRRHIEARRRRLTGDPYEDADNAA